MLFLILFVIERYNFSKINNIDGFFKPLDSYFRFLILVPILFLAYKLKTNLHMFTYGLVLSSLIMLTISCYQIFILKHGRAFGFYSYHNLYGMVHIINALFLIWLYKEIPKKFVLLGIIASIICCLMTGTRGAIILVPFLFMVGLWYYFLNEKKIYLKKILRIITVIVIFLIATIYALPKSFTSERYIQAIEDIKLTNRGNGATTSLGARYEMWKIGLQITQQNPIFGDGVGSFHEKLKNLAIEKTVPAAYATFKGPHNLYVLILAEHGIIVGLGFLVFLLGMPLFLYFVSKSKNNEIKHNNLMLLILFTAFFMLFFLSESVLERHQGMHFFAGIWFYLIGITFNKPAQNNGNYE